MSEAADSDRTDRAYALFAAWSSGDADAPREHLTEDAILWDVIGGEYHGWSDIRAYFAHGLARYPDLTLVPTGQFWTAPDGLALTWEMAATNRDPAFGAEHLGKMWRAPGMSHLVFAADGRVAAEYDYHDKGSRERSLHLS